MIYIVVCPTCGSFGVVKRLKKTLMDRFSMTYMDEVTLFLGVAVSTYSTKKER